MANMPKNIEPIIRAIAHDADQSSA
jgi:hypothetical protein